MKKYSLKHLIITGIICGIIFSGIGAVAVTLTADQVKYTPSNEKFTATNVKEALNEIYKIAEYDIPSDTYFYVDGTSGENIVRYKKVDGKYYLCDQNGKITNETEQDVSGLTLVEYTGATENSLSVGSAAFSSKNFILGDNSSVSNMVLTFNLNGNYSINIDGKVYKANASNKVTVNIEDGKLISTSGTSASGRHDTSHSNSVNVSVSNFKLETK